MQLAEFEANLCRNLATLRRLVTTIAKLFPKIKNIETNIKSARHIPDTIGEPNRFQTAKRLNQRLKFSQFCPSSWVNIVVTPQSPYGVEITVYMMLKREIACEQGT